MRAHNHGNGAVVNTTGLSHKRTRVFHVVAPTRRRPLRTVAIATITASLLVSCAAPHMSDAEAAKVRNNFCQYTQAINRSPGESMDVCLQRAALNKPEDFPRTEKDWAIQIYIDVRKKELTDACVPEKTF